jgi:hypothetical protein
MRTKIIYKDIGIGIMEEIMEDQKVNDSQVFVCEFCGNVLSALRSLKRHIKTSKSCLEIRGQRPSATKSCADCGYESAVMTNFSRHLELCKLRNARMRKEESEEKKRLEERIIRLEAENNVMRQLSTESSHPRIVNNNQFNITLNLQLEHSQRILSPYSALEKEQARLLLASFTKSVFRRGLKGLARIINNKLLTHEGKKWIVSYEPNKQVFHRKNDKEEIEVDDRAEAFLESLMPTIKALVQRHVSDSMSEADNNKEREGTLKLQEIFYPVFERGTPERKKIVRMIADNACTSKASLLSVKPKSENDVSSEQKTITGPKIEFCDTFPSDSSNEWFASHDPKYISWNERQSNLCVRTCSIISNPQ